MLNLMNYLTPLDKVKIENYIQFYGIDKDHYIGNDLWLVDWAS